MSDLMNDNSIKNSTIIKYAKDVKQHFGKKLLEFMDYNDFCIELEDAIYNDNMIVIPEIYRENAFIVAKKLILNEMYVDDYEKTNTCATVIKETNEVIKLIKDSLASKKAKNMGLVHLGFGNYGKKKNGQAVYKTVSGKLSKVKTRQKDFSAKDRVTSKEKSDLYKKIMQQYSKEDEQKDALDKKNGKTNKQKQHGITDIDRVSGQKHTYTFRKDGKRYIMTLNDKEVALLSRVGSVIEIIKNRFEENERRKKGLKVKSKLKLRGTSDKKTEKKD